MARWLGVPLALLPRQKNLETQRKRRLWNVKIDMLRDVKMEPAAGTAAAEHLD